jgi:hypothetical protein
LFGIRKISKMIKGLFRLSYRNVAIMRRFSSMAESSPEVVTPVVVAPSLDELGRSYATGRRKTSVARVWLKEGSGQFTVNGKNFIDYFQPMQRQEITQPFAASKTSCLFDVFCTVKGGGISGAVW